KPRRLLEGGEVGHRRRVEDDEVGAVAGPYEAAAFEAEGASGLRGELPHGLLQAHEALLPHEASEDAGVGAVGARVGPAAQETVGAGIDPRPPEDALHD